MDTYMKLTASWGPWSAFRRYATGHGSDVHQYQSRVRELYVGRVVLCTLCETTLRPSTPFYFRFANLRTERRDFATQAEALAAIRTILEAPL